MQLEHAALGRRVAKQTVEQRDQRRGDAVDELGEASRRVRAKRFEGEADKNQALDQAKDPVHQLHDALGGESAVRERIVGNCFDPIDSGYRALDRPRFSRSPGHARGGRVCGFGGFRVDDVSSIFHAEFSLVRINRLTSRKAFLLPRFVAYLVTCPGPGPPRLLSYMADGWWRAPTPPPALRFGASSPRARVRGLGHAFGRQLKVEAWVRAGAPHRSSCRSTRSRCPMMVCATRCRSWG